MSTPRKPRAKATEPRVLEAVRARRLELVDLHGYTRAIFGIVESTNQPGIALYDRAGRERIALGFNFEGDSIVQVSDKFGRVVASISSEAAPEEVL